MAVIPEFNVGNRVRIVDGSVRHATVSTITSKEILPQYGLVYGLDTGSRWTGDHLELAETMFHVGDRVMATPANGAPPFEDVIADVIVSKQHAGHSVIYKLEIKSGTWDSDHLSHIAKNTIADLDAAYQDGYAYRSSVANFRNPYTEQLQALKDGNYPGQNNNEWLRLYALAVAFNKGHEQWKLEQKILKELRTLNRTRQPQKDAKPSSKRTKKPAK